MPKQGTRQEAEHRLAGYVSEWIAECEQKALAMKEHNDAIKAIEVRIEELSAEIEGGAYQLGLPFGRDKAVEATEKFIASVPADSSVTVSAGGESVTITGKDAEKIRQKRAAKHKPPITMAESDVLVAPAPVDPTPAAETASPAPSETLSTVQYGKGCTVCAPLRCKAYSGIPKGLCRTCGHYEEYHKGPGAMVDPLGIAEAGEAADATL